MCSSAIAWSLYAARVNIRAWSLGPVRVPAWRWCRRPGRALSFGGRDYVTPEDLFALAEDVVLHRLRMTYEAVAAGQAGAAVLKEILSDLG